MSMIFVFGSNEAGRHRHSKGTALTAVRHHRAVHGQGFGPQGNSFAIPTKDWRIETLPADVIEQYVQRFIVYARMHPELQFQVTALGTGLAGHRHDVMAPMFKYAPDNCSFDQLWEIYLPKKKFWGSL